MKLRGVLNPKFHFVVMAIFIAISVWVALTVRDSQAELASSWLDLRLLPFGFLLGAAVGIPIGIWRLRAIHMALHDVSGKFYITDTSILNRFREGAKALQLRKIGILFAFGLCLTLMLHTGGRIMLMGSFAFYIFGQYLTGQFIPFARLFFEIRREEGRASEKTY